MKVKKMVTVYLTEEEMKAAIKNYLIVQSYDFNIAKHLEENEWTIDYDNEGGYAILIDGEIEEE